MFAKDDRARTTAHSCRWRPARWCAAHVWTTGGMASDTGAEFEKGCGAAVMGGSRPKERQRRTPSKSSPLDKCQIEAASAQVTHTQTAEEGSMITKARRVRESIRKALAGRRAHQGGRVGGADRPRR